MPKSKYIIMAVVTVALMLTLASGASFAAASWANGGATLPSATQWDRVWGDQTTEPLSVTANNDSADTEWDTTYGLLSVRGVTGAASLVDRWGTVFQAVSATVPTGGSQAFAGPTFLQVAPPLTTLEYQFSGSFIATSPAVVDTIDNNWLMAKDFTPTPLPVVGSMLIQDTATGQTSINHFPDTIPSTGALGGWASFYIEQCAGRVPRVVSGFPTGIYGPGLAVARDAMAVFIARGALIPVPTLTANPFPDVLMSSFGAAEIQACVLGADGTDGTDDDVVNGYTDGLYRPTVHVDRAQMSVFVARAAGLITAGEPVAGGASNPAGEAFSDVPSTHWAGHAIQVCVDNNIVQGYPTTPAQFRPALDVTRDQMAVFVYRGFIQNGGVPVVLGGPAFTTVNPGGDGVHISLPGEAAYYGWSSINNGNLTVPTYEYVILDAARLGPEAIVAPATTYDITFELRDAAGATTAANTHVVSLTALNLADARNAAVTTGSPYLTIYWNLQNIVPALITTPDTAYTLHVFAKGKDGIEVELLRQPTFTTHP